MVAGTPAATIRDRLNGGDHQYRPASPRIYREDEMSCWSPGRHYPYGPKRSISVKASGKTTS
jgi:hypothetical protein